ncbi:MAG: hypothetical protein GEU95_00915 [Rhizobiales bacterium]|nr:hypothetical protein [Hyphomicrobiales bacterium]
MSIAIVALLAAGLALSLAAFYPGYMSVDAQWVYKATLGALGDWQSPVMSVLWHVIDPIAPGSMSMFLLMLLLYWGAFALVAFTVARTAGWLGVVTMLLAFTPPAFFFVGLIWRDILFADVWLFAAALTYAAASRPAAVRWPAQTTAMLLVALGVLLRPNAIIAAPLLATYVMWPTAFYWKRVAAILIPGIFAGYALVHAVYYTVLNAERSNPLHSVFVFDLGGISYYSGVNEFPVTFTPEQTAMMFTSQCYNPDRWDYYWHIAPCDFVMQRLERKDDTIFGTPRLVEAWRNAVLSNPLAYLKHRASVMRAFLSRDVLLIPVLDLDEPSRQIHAQNPLFMAMVAVQNVLQPLWLLSLGVWLAIAIVICALAWPLRTTPSGAFVLGVSGSGIVYVLTFFPFGVAADFRYGYWCVLASLTGAVVVLAGRHQAKY